MFLTDPAIQTGVGARNNEMQPSFLSEKIRHLTSASAVRLDTGGKGCILQLLWNIHPSIIQQVWGHDKTQGLLVPPVRVRGCTHLDR